MSRLWISDYSIALYLFFFFQDVQMSQDVQNDEPGPKQGAEDPRGLLEKSQSDA